MGYNTPQHLKDEASELLYELLQEHHDIHGTLYMSEDSLAFDSRVLKHQRDAELWLSRAETSFIIRLFLSTIEHA